MTTLFLGHSDVLQLTLSVASGWHHSCQPAASAVTGSAHSELTGVCRMISGVYAVDCQFDIRLKISNWHINWHWCNWPLVRLNKTHSWLKTTAITALTKWIEYYLVFLELWNTYLKLLVPHKNTQSGALCQWHTVLAVYRGFLGCWQDWLLKAITRNLFWHGGVFSPSSPPLISFLSSPYFLSLIPFLPFITLPFSFAMKCLPSNPARGSREAL